jgi:glycosyltransferase involved in cell wall biosynthesis
LRADDTHIAPARDEGLTVFAADILSDRKRPLATAARLARSASVLNDHIRRAGADSVLLAMNFATAAPLAMAAQKPIVYFAHDPAPHPGDYAPQLQRLAQGLVIARSRVVVGLSSHSEALLRDMAPPEKVRLSPLGAVFEPIAAPRLQPPAGPARLLFIGRLIAYKGLDLLAEALRVIAHRQDWRLTVAGFGPEAGRAAALLKPFPQVAPLQAGWLPDEAMTRLQREHDILLAPYVSATQSGTVAESLALGAPVVATPAGGLPEQIGAGGWLAPRIDAAAYAAALTRALDEHAAYAAKSAAALAQARGFWDGRWSWLEAI